MVSLCFFIMRRFRKLADIFFGYNMRERRSTVVLIVFLAVLIVVRYVNVPREQPLISVTITEDNGTPQTVNDRPAAVVAEAESLFVFDPNRVSEAELLKLGLSRRQASTFISYRKAGARFRSAADMGKVYGFTPALQKKLTPWVNIAEEPVSGNTERHTDSVGRRGRYPATQTFTPVELNTCNAEDLIKLPGIGEVLSGRIIRYRDLLGGYASVRQLGEVYGIDTSLLRRLRGMVYADSCSVHKIAIDTCGYRTLSHHPYIGPAAARSILRYRRLIGQPLSIEELVRQKALDSSAACKMAPYCTFAGKASGGLKD